MGDRHKRALRDAVGAGLSRWSGETGTKGGEERRSRLNRAVRLDTIAA